MIIRRDILKIKCVTSVLYLANVLYGNKAERIYVRDP